MLHLRIFLKNYWESQNDEFSKVKHEEHFSDKEPCNIYLIGTRPRIKIDPNFLTINNTEIGLLFKIQRQDEFDEVYGTIKSERKIVGDAKIESEYPYTRFIIKDDLGYLLDSEAKIKETNLQIKAAYAIRVAKLERELDISDLEILYVGQSLKMDKRVSPKKRLSAHKKMQLILDKCVTKYIDKEVYVILCSFVHKIDLIHDAETLAKVSEDHDIIDLVQKNIKKLNANKELVTQLAEAMLIDHFNTDEFNSDFIGSFGRPTHKYYSYIKDSNLSTISMEVDLSSLCNIYSKSIDRLSRHFWKYFPKKNFEKSTIAFDKDDLLKY